MTERIKKKKFSEGSEEVRRRARVIPPVDAPSPGAS